MTDEEWRPIPGFADYSVSDQGRVMSTKGRTPRILRANVAGNGYRLVGLYRDGSQNSRTVHELVAEAFKGPRPAPKSEVRHLNGDYLDCRAVNLQWGSRSENLRDAVRHGTHYWAKQTRCKQGHPFDTANERQRICRTCRRAANRRYAARRAFRAANVPGLEAAA